MDEMPSTIEMVKHVKGISDHLSGYMDYLHEGLSKKTPPGFYVEGAMTYLLGGVHYDKEKWEYADLRSRLWRTIKLLEVVEEDFGFNG